jgi:hypothetical protein
MTFLNDSFEAKSYYENGALEAEDRAISISVNLYRTKEKLFFKSGAIKETRSFKEIMGKEVPDGEERFFSNDGQVVKTINWKNGIPQYSDQAVEISTASLTVSPEPGNVNLSLTYTNLTRRTISGIYTRIQIFNPFREKVLEQTYDEEIVIEPNTWVRDSKQIEGSSMLYQAETNDPGVLYALAQNGTAKIKAAILKVAFDDGTVIKMKSSNGRKN